MTHRDKASFRLFRVALVLAIVLGLNLPSPTPVWSLEHNQVEKLTRDYPDFKAAEEEILEVWQQVMKKLSGNPKKTLRKAQLEWIKTHRDTEARALMDQGVSFAEAYTRVTRKKSEELRQYLTDAPKPQPPAEVKEAPPKPPQAIEEKKVRTVVQRGHSGGIHVIKFSPNEKYVASGAVKIWETATNRLLCSWPGKGQLRSFQDGFLLFTKTVRNRFIMLRQDPVDGALLEKDEVSIPKLYHSLIIPDNWHRPFRLIQSSAGTDVIEVFELPSGLHQRTIQLPSNKNRIVSYSPNGRFVITVPLDGTRLDIWDLETGRLFLALKNKTMKKERWGYLGLKGHAISNSGRFLMIQGGTTWTDDQGRTFSCPDQKALVLDLKTMSVVHRFDDPSFIAEAFYTFNMEDRFLIGSSGESCDLIRVKDWKIMDLGLEKARTVVVSPSGRFVAIGGIGHVGSAAVFLGSDFRIVDLERNEEKWKSIEGFNIANAAVTVDGRTLAIGEEDQDHRTRLIDLRNGHTICTFPTAGNYRSSLDFSSDGNYLLVKELTGYEIWSVSDKRMVAKGELPLELPYSSFSGEIAMSPDNEFLAVACGSTSREYGAMVRVIQMDDQTVAADIEDKNVDEIHRIAIHPNSRLLAILEHYKKKKSYGIRIWDVIERKEIRRFQLEMDENPNSPFGFTNDGKFLIAESSVWDTATWRKLRTKEASAVIVNLKTTREMLVLNFHQHHSPEMGVIVDTSGEMVRLLDSTTKQERVSILNRDDADLMVTPEGYFMGTGDFSRYVHFVRGLTSYDFNQFYDVFYRPDIVQAKLKGEDISDLITLTVDEALENPPPTVKLTGVPESTKDKQLSVRYSIQSTGGGIGEVRVFHNGKLIVSDGFYRTAKLPGSKTDGILVANGRSIHDQLRAIKKQGTLSPVDAETKGDNFEDSVIIETVPGENTVSLAAFNAQNTVQSRLETVSFTADVPAEDPHFFLLAVGIDQYKDPGIQQLSLAVKDANDMAARLKEQAKTLYKPENIHVTVLEDQKATKTNILSAMKDIARKAKVGDSFVLFSAGHGLLIGNQYYIVPFDIDLNSKTSTLVGSNDLVEMSKKIKAMDQLFIFDTCHAGGVDYIVSGLYDARMSVLAKKMGLHVYAAASPQGGAIDGFQGKNGLFTHVLLDGLGNNQALDSDRDHRVSVVELGKFSRKRTVDLAKNLGHRQEPLIIHFGHDYPVYKLQEKAEN